MMKMPYPLPNVFCGGTLMRNINLFVEDVAHEDFLTALIKRLANASNVEISIKTSSVRGGHGMVITELKQYLRDLQRYKEDLAVTPTRPRAFPQLDHQQHGRFRYLCQYGAWKVRQ